MKKTYLIIFVIFSLFIAGCSNENKTENSSVNSNILPENKNTVENSINTEFENKLNEMEFNSNLTSYEQKYLKYYQDKYPTARIYHMKTNTYLCDNCYDIYYKKDREILLIKIRDNKIGQESIIKTDIGLYIQTVQMCQLFSGNWNTCPKICPTDETSCTTQCAAPKCEFDELKIIYKKNGETCGGLDMGDCEYGFTCAYDSKDAKYGICILKK